jgi:hypothetical protein
MSGRKGGRLATPNVAMDKYWDGGDGGGGGAAGLVIHACSAARNTSVTAYR